MQTSSKEERQKIDDFLKLLSGLNRSSLQNRVKQNRSDEYGENADLQKELEEEAVKRAYAYLEKGQLPKALNELAVILTQSYGATAVQRWMLKYYRNIAPSTHRTHIEVCIDAYLDAYDEATLGERRLAKQTAETMLEYKDDLEKLYKSWKKSKDYHNSRADFLNFIANKVEDQVKETQFNRIFESVYGRTR